MRLRVSNYLKFMDKGDSARRYTGAVHLKGSEKFIFIFNPHFMTKNLTYALTFP